MIATSPETLYLCGFAGFLFARGTRRVHGGISAVSLIARAEPVQAPCGLLVLMRIEVAVNLQSGLHIFVPKPLPTGKMFVPRSISRPARPWRMRRIRQAELPGASGSPAAPEAVRAFPARANRRPCRRIPLSSFPFRQKAPQQKSSRPHTILLRVWGKAGGRGCRQSVLAPAGFILTKEALPASRPREIESIFQGGCHGDLP